MIDSKVSYNTKSQDILINGDKIQIISGAMHYFRIHQDQWQDRLTKLVQAGFNCVETYMCWNLHEPVKGEFDFSGMLDFERFIKIAQELGLYVIVRPGPYICAEWDNGGFPAWLMVEKDIQFRRMNDVYLKHVDDYFSVILPKLKKLDYDHNGPIIAMQIENEYGSYCHDKDYLLAVKNMFLNNNITIPLFTADGASEFYIQGGTLDDETPVALTYGCRENGAHSLEALEILRSIRANDPLFCMELWAGWFDHWGEELHTSPAMDAAMEVDSLIQNNGNVNIYMFHGGTNFGFTAGANGLPNSIYEPDVTSYDYNAPLDEAGNPTEKYFAIQKVIKNHFPNAKIATPTINKSISYGKVELTECAKLFDNLDNIAAKKLNSITPLKMEEMGQNFGFIHYRTRIEGKQGGAFEFLNVNDRAQLFINGELFHTYFRNDTNKKTAQIQIPQEGVQIDLLVENFGHINYGALTGIDFKGIAGALLFGTQSRINFEQWSLPMQYLSKLEFVDFNDSCNEPIFYRGEFEVNEIADTYLKFPGVCGVAYINGFNLGRYWNIGPTTNLYVPAPILKQGKNEVIIFETEKLNDNFVEFEVR